MESNTNIKKVCEFCGSVIESKYDLLTCPKCKSPYHIECWYQNNGCTNKICNYKVVICQNEVLKNYDIDDLLINVEYLINNNRFIDAINECRRILEIDKDNLKAKEFFNRAISNMNIKMKLIEAGDSALSSEDLEAAELYYNRALDYADKSESDLLKTKLYVIKEKYPKLIKKRRKSKFIINTFGIGLILVLGFLVFYNLYLKEYLDFNYLEQNDNFSNIVLMEQQIKQYEAFIYKYKKGEFVDRAKSKINTLSFYLIENLYKDNWRNALFYLNTMDSSFNPVIYKELKNKIHISANKEVDSVLQLFNKNYYSDNLDEAKNNLNVLYEISKYFPDTEIEKLVSNLQKKINFKVKRGNPDK